MKSVDAEGMGEVSAGGPDESSGHMPYIRAVYAAMGRMKPSPPEAGMERGRRWARLRMRIIGDSLRKRISEAALRWDENQGWSIRVLGVDGTEEVLRCWMGIVPPPVSVVRWFERRLEEFGRPGLDGQMAMDELIIEMEAESKGEESAAQALAKYAEPPRDFAEVRSQIRVSQPPEPNFEVGVTSLTEVMRSHLDGAETSYGREFSVLSGTWKRGGRYLCIYIDETGGDEYRSVVGIGVAEAGVRVGTYERKLGVELYRKLPNPLTVRFIADGDKWIAKALERNGPAPEKTGKRIVDKIRSAVPRLAEHIELLKNELIARPPGTQDRDVRPYERDAVGVLFEAFDIDRDLLTQWRPGATGAPFMAGLPKEHSFSHANPQEKWHIDYDANTFLGLVREKTDRVEWGLFKNRSQTRVMLVANVDSTPHEKRYGVDLVYFNPLQGSVVMVQYKVMKESPSGPVSGVDERFLSQIDRMRATDESMRDPDPRHPDIRLVDTPCFVKLTNPVNYMSPTGELIPVMYLSREHFEVVHEKSLAQSEGNRGKVGLRTAPRYLSTTEFTMLLSNGWIGSRGTATGKLAEMLDASISGGRAVVMGVHLDDLPLGNFSDGRR